MGAEAGRTINAKFQLLQKLGKGASGEVWLARHLHLESNVAVKLLNPGSTADAISRQRFVREARAVASLRSPYVVQVFDFGVFEDRAFLAMEYLVGETLENRLEEKGRLSLIDVARICTHIGKALHTAHVSGIVHRDVKPENVFLVDYGDEEIAKVVDFGVQKTFGTTEECGHISTLTREGAMLGTPYYMSPEQIQDSGRVDHRTDLWALGVIAYRCVVGQLPFRNDNLLRLIVAICNEPIPVPSMYVDVPPGFDNWFKRAVARDPKRRFQSAKVMTQELCDVLLGACTAGAGQRSVANPSFITELLWSGSHPRLRLQSQATSAAEASESPGQTSVEAHVASSRPSNQRDKKKYRAVGLVGVGVVVMVAAGWLSSRRAREVAGAGSTALSSAASSVEATFSATPSDTLLGLQAPAASSAAAVAVSSLPAKSKAPAKQSPKVGSVARRAPRLVGGEAKAPPPEPTAQSTAPAPAHAGPNPAEPERTSLPAFADRY